MNIYAISDLHLSGFQPKPMDIFGDNWKDHWDKIRFDWKQKVKPSDVVLIPGDISWAMRLSEAEIDLEQVGALVGTKVILKGNHDYWWSSVSKVKSIISDDTLILQNNAHIIGDYAIVGTRGWTMRGDRGFDENDEKIYLREIERLKLSLCAVSKQDKIIIAMTHFPLISNENLENEFLQLFYEYGVKYVVYGHIHAESAKRSFNGTHNGIVFKNVSCDLLDFKLHQIV